MIKKMAEELDRVNQRLDQLTEHHKRSLEGAIKQQVMCPVDHQLNIFVSVGGKAAIDHS